MPSNGGYDKPFYSGSTRMGRNKELTDEWTLLEQATRVNEASRKSIKQGKIRASDTGGAKKVTNPPLSV